MEFAVAAFANPVFARLPDDSFRAARSDGSRLVGKVMPFWYVGTLLVLVAVAFAAGGGVRWLCGITAALMAAVVLLTVTMLVPINNRIARWSASADVSRGLATRWDRLHWVRVGVLVVLFVVLTIAVT